VASSIRLEGYALHRGVVTAVTLSAREGPITFEQGGRRAYLSALTVRRSDAGVAVTDGHGLELDLVEHFLAALGGLGIKQGVTAIAEGKELPILDGGARAFAEALLALALPVSAPQPAHLVVRRAGCLAEGDSSYVFELGQETALSVEAVFDHPAIGTQHASWDGSSRAFLEAIAPARTFGFQADAAALWQSGRAELAARSSDDLAVKAFSRAVVVYGEVAPLRAFDEPPPQAGEIARHKLLDLIGDFVLYGGPPQGRVFARRPGHTVSHRIIRQALRLGILSTRQ
jgi:UDP-3-O-[3-hydroxymyristoyl] N-acetylglucosamine deacetylase